VDTVILVNFGVEWEFAVHVTDGLNDKAILGPRAALNYLHNERPMQTGHEYWTALRACYDALCYRCQPEVARVCFVVAYASYRVRTGD
jgi:hypothetical protein